MSYLSIKFIGSQVELGICSLVKLQLLGECSV